MSITFPLTINDEIGSNPRLNGYFELYAGTSGFTFLQNIVDGSQPIAIFNYLDKSVEFLLRKPLPWSPAAETATQPLVRCSES